MLVQKYIERLIGMATFDFLSELLVLPASFIYLPLLVGGLLIYLAYIIRYERLFRYNIVYFSFVGLTHLLMTVFLYVMLLIGFINPHGWVIYPFLLFIEPMAALLILDILKLKCSAELTSKQKNYPQYFLYVMIVIGLYIKIYYLGGM